MKRLLVTGAAGKVGSHAIERILADDEWRDVQIRALYHNRVPSPRDGVEIVRGSISDREAVRAAMQGVTHVLHCATCKETPDEVIDVTVKGLFWLLEECRASPSFKQIILIGGDGAVGHFFYAHPIPVTEEQKHTAYPGCYALSKVLEEVMLEQYFVQYDLTDVVCARPGSWKTTISNIHYHSVTTFSADRVGGIWWGPRARMRM
jgi:UDP-glucose 4-epimerase